MPLMLNVFDTTLILFVPKACVAQQRVLCFVAGTAGLLLEVPVSTEHKERAFPAPCRDREQWLPSKWSLLVTLGVLEK